jgi:hypothetical protein
MEERNHVDGVSKRHEMIRSLSGLISSISYKYVLSMIVACLIGSLMATIAYSQELPSDAPTSVGASFPSGWWSPEPAESATAPQLVIGMTEPTNFKVSDSLRPAGAQPNSDRPIEPTEAAIAGLPHFELTDGSVVMPSPLTDGVSLTPPSSFAFLHAQYSTWELSMANSRSLTEVNGATVHPLLQVNYAGWQLPVTLYTSSLRDGEAR